MSRENMGGASGSLLLGSGALGTTDRRGSGGRVTGKGHTADLCWGLRRPDWEGVGPIATATTASRSHRDRRLTATGVAEVPGAARATGAKRVGMRVVQIGTLPARVTQTSMAVPPASLVAPGESAPLHRGSGAVRPIMEEGGNIPTLMGVALGGHGSPGSDRIPGAGLAASMAPGAGTPLPGTRGSVILGWEPTGDGAPAPGIVDIALQADDNGSR
jgi:hypothetical protein